MAMNRILLAVAVLLASAAADAQIYQWKDDNGKTVISDKPPAGSARQQRKIDADAPGENAVQKTTADRELEFRKRQKEAQENAEKSRQEQTVLAARKETCTAARRQLNALESGERIGLRDDKGERYFMDYAQRRQEIEKARQLAATNCQ
jgi:hypothetical protein